MAREPDPDFEVNVRIGADLPAWSGELDDDVVVSSSSVTDRDLTGRRAHLVDLEECRWTRCRLAESELTKLSASDQVFDGCDLAVLTAEDASVQRVRFTGCRMSGIRLGGSTIQHAELTDAVADYAGLRFARLKQVRFDRCRLAEADFTEATLDQVVFRSCDLSAAQFHSVRILRAWFIDCTWDRTAGVESLRGAVIEQSDPLDYLALLGGLAAAAGIRLVEPSRHS